MRPRLQVLVIEDEPEMLDLLGHVLTAQGFKVLKAQDALSGLRTAYQSHPDAILLDVGLPQVNGFEACARLRELTDVPILFITGKATTTEDVVRGFSLGADDYVLKPFSCSELIGRLNACLHRRNEKTNDSSEYLSPTPSIVLDCTRRELAINGRIIYLCPTEFAVLRLLMTNSGKAVSQDTLLVEAWGQGQATEFERLKQCIYRLRKKIESTPGSPRYLYSVRGKGYCFKIPGSDLT